MADDVDRSMREVLVELALTSNGATASFEASTSGGYYEDTVPELGFHDAPHLHYARKYDEAETNADRLHVLGQARDELKAIRRSSGDPSREESRAERNARIVEHGAGVLARDVAVWARCGIRDVWAARREAGRDEEWGRETSNGHDLADLKAEIKRRADGGSPARQIAMQLRISYSTVLRALDRKK